MSPEAKDVVGSGIVTACLLGVVGGACLGWGSHPLHSIFGACAAAFAALVLLSVILVVVLDGRR